MEDHPVTLQVRALADLDLEPLRQVWRAHWGAPPSLRSPQLLRRLIAWRLQVAAFGDIPAETRAQLRRPASRRRSALLNDGSTVAREWKGRVHEVQVVGGAFVYAGQTYRSLSQIAFHITGTKWNGPRFFGLTAAP